MNRESEKKFRVSKIIKISNFLMAFIMIAFACCDQITDTEDGIKTWFTGIVQTDVNGKLLKDDPEDWQPRWDTMEKDTTHGYYLRPTVLALKPAWPNPAGTDSAVYQSGNKVIGCFVMYAIPDLATVSITIQSSPGCTVKTIMDSQFQAGYYTFLWDLTDDSVNPLPNNIYRMYFHVQTDDTLYQSYGDIAVSRNN